MGVWAALLWTDAPLWVWLTVIGVSAGLSLAGLLIGGWFHRRRRE